MICLSRIISTRFAAHWATCRSSTLCLPCVCNTLTTRSSSTLWKHARSTGPLQVSNRWCRFHSANQTGSKESTPKARRLENCIQQPRTCHLAITQHACSLNIPRSIQWLCHRLAWGLKSSTTTGARPRMIPRDPKAISVKLLCSFPRTNRRSTYLAT